MHIFEDFYSNVRRLFVPLSFIPEHLSLMQVRMQHLMKKMANVILTTVKAKIRIKLLNKSAVAFFPGV